MAAIESEQKNEGILNKKIFFLINPYAGGGKALSWWKKHQPLLDKAGYDYFWEFSHDEGLENQVRQAVLEQGAEAIAVVGGDGTIHHALNGLMEGDKPLRDDLVLIPCPVGSGQDFAKSVYGSGRGNLLELLEQGIVRPIDVGRCWYRDTEGQKQLSYFINGFDAGAGADTCIRVNDNNGILKRFLGGKLAFLGVGLAVLLDYKYTKAMVEYDGGREEGEYIIIGVGNGVYVGGGMKMFPGALLDDGELNLLLVEKRGFLRILAAMIPLYRGTVPTLRRVLYCRSTHIHITTQHPIAIELDGEVPGTTDVDLTVIPHAISLLSVS